ncbi:hypothetical protein VTN00DRAFT_1229 [Thermoascus crustaceus]|uniref:uncharacterized protein n=1 Tax=Thermoascus crustaceus TaxID=5088 RepID=UPI0037439D3A
MPMMQSRPDPCQNCRNHHSRCDSIKPKCLRCQRSGRECVRRSSRLRFRHGSSARYDHEFSKDQVWLSSSNNGSATYEYIDETPHLAPSYTQSPVPVCSPELNDHRRNVSLSIPTVPIGTTGTESVAASSDPTHSEIPKSPLNQDFIDSVPTGNRNIELPQSTTGYQSLGPLHSPRFSRDCGISPSTSASYDAGAGSHWNFLASSDNARQLMSRSPCDIQEESSWSICPPLLIRQHTVRPRFDIQEACLMKYFVENLAKWFDLCDPKRHFTNTVPQRAFSCPPLLNAVLATSARHLSTLPRNHQNSIIAKFCHPRFLKLGEETSLQYHNKCIAHLRSLSEDPNSIMNEDLFAAVVVLRFYEEIDAPLISLGFANETGLRGLQVFIEAQATSALSSPGLRQAAFWVGFRQEILMAFLQQRSFRLPLGICDSYRSWDPAPDHVWANRLMIFCADVLQYCFSSYHPRSTAQYEELINFHTRWLELRPRSFSPIYYREPDRRKGEVLPEAWYLADCHIVGIQNMDLAMILLTVYNPNMPRLGLGQQDAARSMDEKIKAIVLEICGIAMSNRQSPPAFLTATLAITMCGDRFTDLVEQQALLNVLIETDRDNAWPTAAMQKKLRETWGWERR